MGISRATINANAIIIYNQSWNEVQQATTQHSSNLKKGRSLAMWLNNSSGLCMGKKKKSKM